MARTTLFTDTFTRADEDPIASPWGAYSGVDGLRLSSNAVMAKALSAAVDNVQSHNGTLPTDQWCEAKLGIWRTAGFGAIGLCWAAPNTLSGYLVLITFNIDNIAFAKYTSGTFAAPSGGNASATLAFAAGDILSMEREGTALRAYKNGTLAISTTDAAFTGGRAALELYPTSALDDLTWDDFASGGFTTGGGRLVGPNRLARMA